MATLQIIKTKSGKNMKEEEPREEINARRQEPSYNLEKMDLEITQTITSKMSKKGTRANKKLGS